MQGTIYGGSGCAEQVSCVTVCVAFRQEVQCDSQSLCGRQRLPHLHLHLLNFTLHSGFDCPPRSRAGRGHPASGLRVALQNRHISVFEVGAARFKKWHPRGQPTQNGRAGVEHAGNTSVLSDALYINMSTKMQRTLRSQACLRGQ